MVSLSSSALKDEAVQDGDGDLVEEALEVVSETTLMEEEHKQNL